MARIDKLAIASRAAAAIPVRVKSLGLRHPTQPAMPGHWELQADGLKIWYTEGVLLYPEDPALSSSLEVWPENGGKIFSINWHPERPWMPVRVVCFKPGDWLKTLGLDA
jgi:hypothetical protein